MGKNYIESAKLIDKNALYTPSEALDLAVKTARRRGRWQGLPGRRPAPGPSRGGRRIRSGSAFR